MVKDKILKSHTFENEFPKLMKHKSGSIFFVNKFGFTHTMMCLDIGIRKRGDYPVGSVLRLKKLTGFKPMKEGFFIEMVVNGASGSTRNTTA